MYRAIHNRAHDRLEEMTDDHRLLPHLPSRTNTDATPRLLHLAEDDTDEVFDALGSKTARELYLSIQGEPASPAELTERLGLSIQNVHYHLRKLHGAELIEVVATGYSEKGVEMKVYGLTADPLVLSATSSDQWSEVRQKFEYFVGAIVLLSGISIIVQWIATHYLPSILGHSPSGTGRPPMPAPGVHPIQPNPSVPPGLVFFLGGIAVLLLVIGWYYRHHINDRILANPIN